jgi:hypothetical protein
MKKRKMKRTREKVFELKLKKYDNLNKRKDGTVQGQRGRD